MADKIQTEGDHWCDLFESALITESERAQAILAVSILDESLEQLIKNAMLPSASSDDPLFDGAYAPLGSFSAKVDFAARLGLISTGVSQSLHLIRKIRNEFAHNISGCRFDDPKIRSRVRELHKLNDVAEPKRRMHFAPGALGDFQVAASWLIYWIWNIIERMPSRCPECGRLHRKEEPHTDTSPQTA